MKTTKEITENLRRCRGDISENIINDPKSTGLFREFTTNLEFDAAYSEKKLLS